MKAARPGKLKRQEDQASFVSWRFALLCGCILLALVGLMLRVAYLQVINPDRLVKEGDMRSLRVQEVPTARGMICLLYTSPSPRDRTRSRMPSSA